MKVIFSSELAATRFAQATTHLGKLTGASLAKPEVGYTMAADEHRVTGLP